MNSSVVVAMIGLRSSKILGYDSRAKKCRVCETAARNGTVPPEHDCRRNWYKSSKAMKPDVAVSLTKSLQQEGIELGALVADNDAATIKRLREVDVGIEKWADLSHAKKNFGSRLDGAKTTHPELKNYKVVAHITKCFIYAIKSNKDEPADIARSLMNAPRHLFGHHDACGNWCQAAKLSNPAEYKSKCLPVSSESRSIS